MSDTGGFFTSTNFNNEKKYYRTRRKQLSVVTDYLQNRMARLLITITYEARNINWLKFICTLVQVGNNMATHDLWKGHVISEMCRNTQIFQQRRILSSLEILETREISLDVLKGKQLNHQIMAILINSVIFFIKIRV